ncbi:hypothetical protein H9638_12070 [Arthrobacter sp. Sa2BUA2]|uniref:Rv3660c-like CheY-like N-terminal domain-containing protein n=1 Tax=Arthrobacter pullicola TaxID=2762224 RepID=A0ABR8YKX6_9MICC|nr:septum site-determining protein Ssd [Arthrobacter pullicola]MBD8044544.1 hypothetical protein [Arthrobacter pullicola]
MTDTVLWLPERQRRGASLLPTTKGGESAGTDSLVLVRPGEQRLQDEAARIAVAAGVELILAEDLAEAVRYPCGIVLIAADGLARDGQSLGALRGIETICIGFESDRPWTHAARCSVDRVVVLPDGGAWLAEYLARRNSPTGSVIGVAGTFGGSGGSTLACLLAQEAAAQGCSVLLADADPSGAGLEHRLGAGASAGLRWKDLADVRGTVNPAQLVSALPTAGGFSLLTHPAGEPPPPGLDREVLPSVLQAARAGFDQTFLDLGACPGARSPALAQCDVVLAVLAGRAQLLLAARSWWTSLRTDPPETLAVVRGPLGEGLDEVRVSELVGMRLAGYVPCVRALSPATDHGRILELRRRRLRSALVRILREIEPVLPGVP